MAGLIGSHAYRAFTVIGDQVNIAARIEALSLRGQVLMSEETYTHCRDFVQVTDPVDVHVKGKRALMRVREALGIPSLGKVMPRQDVRVSPRVQVRIPLAYWLLEGKLITGSRTEGLIRDLSYNGALVQLERPLPLYAELKLAFDLPSVNYHAREIYGRVVSVLQRNGEALSGVEFTSLSGETTAQVRHFVQMALQGEY
jgi:adenylate cyclase